MNEAVEFHKEASTIKARGGTETILFGEDNEGLREASREILESLGYRILFAGNGEEALRPFQQHHESIDLLLLDVVMPMRNGPDALARMRALQPDIPVIFTTGYSPEPAALNRIVKDHGVILQNHTLPTHSDSRSGLCRIENSEPSIIQPSARSAARYGYRIQRSARAE